MLASRNRELEERERERAVAHLAAAVKERFAFLLVGVVVEQLLRHATGTGGGGQEAQGLLHLPIDTASGNQLRKRRDA